MDFDLKFYQCSGEYTLDLRTVELEMLMTGNRWREHRDGIQVLDARGDHLGNLKPCNPNYEKVAWLRDHFRQREDEFIEWTADQRHAT